MLLIERDFSENLLLLTLTKKKNYDHYNNFPLHTNVIMPILYALLKVWLLALCNLLLCMSKVKHITV